MGLFNKTFFHFAFGFVALIALSFLVITVVGYLEEEEQERNVSTAAEVKQ